MLDRLARMADAALAAIEPEDLLPAGVGVALPGLVEAQTGTLLRAPNLGWSEIPVADELAARLPNLAVRADNEANLAAVAEHWQGAARDLDNFVYVFGEVGVGGGIFVDGSPLPRGARVRRRARSHHRRPRGAPVQLRLERLPRDVRRVRRRSRAGPVSRWAPREERAT